ncbi:uncharacterized protein LOC130746496 [Lotus japonicus]|uniref:PGG domain-containing protein n=1 Tax=Lotus japonicus TaxID=34305 RepID=I3SKH4_LOTJA|nr:uncharacterized protein LOC130746496 [Lotus japonicus]AFK40766.1 unknown [Lotus japonicus]
MSTHVESSTIGGKESAPSKSLWGKFLSLVDRFLRDEDTEKWVKNMRGSVSLTASIIATMAFQLATNPPGGVFQANGGDSVAKIKSCLDNDAIQCPGEAVLAVVNEDDYSLFLTFNTISFISSLSVCLLLVSGIPLKHRVIIWILSIGMCISITSLALTYLVAASMVTPNHVWGNVFALALIIWIGLLGIVSVYLIIRMIYSVGKWITKCYRPFNSHFIV